MTKDEAMKLALEKIADALPAYIDGVASRDYLATIHKARAEQPAQQEPVAWMHVMDNTEGIKANGTGVTLYTQKQKHPFGKLGIDFSKSYPITSTPLYTSPPAQRKPLTTKEIREWWASENGLEDCHMAKLDDFEQVVRAIEAAHGIKENT